MVLYTRVSDITLWGYYQPLTISIRTTMTALIDIIPEVTAFVEAIGYVVISVVMAVIVLKNTD